MANAISRVWIPVTSSIGRCRMVTKKVIGNCWVAAATIVVVPARIMPTSRLGRCLDTRTEKGGCSDSMRCAFMASNTGVSWVKRRR
ncbi:hypothetical protein D9M70_595260 [compost metagenome]